MISVVIPVYNCTAALGPYIERLAGQLTALNRQFECILVDDGSAAEAKRVLADLSQKRFVKLLECDGRGGQQRATARGIKASCGDIIITLDDDGKHDLAIIGQLLASLQWADIAFGIERVKKHSPLRAFFSLPVSRLINRHWPMATPYYVSSYRCFKRKLFDAAAFDAAFFYTSCELLKRARAVENIFYDPAAGQPSRYKLTDKIKLFFNIVKTYGW